jgi:hypothetical protein
MLQLANDTPFTPGMFVLPDAHGVETLYPVLKATFEFDPRGGIHVAATQQPLVLADEYWGEPASSSLKYPSDVHLRKPGTDVLLVGDAWAPGGRPATEVAVAFRVGPVARAIRVSGDRVWQKTFGGLEPSRPEPFARLPLRHERAFGGSDAGSPPKFDPRNPVGCGFRGRRSAKECEGTRVPNLEDPRDLVQSPRDDATPAGVGPVAASWAPRRGFAGTYDDAWRTTRAPYLPPDFDPRFFHSAPPGQTSLEPLRGGEPVELRNLSPAGLARFALPRCEAAATARIASRSVRVPLALETVLLEPNDARIVLLFRGAVPCDKAALRIERVAFALGKIDLAGGAG